MGGFLQEKSTYLGERDIRILGIGGADINSFFIELTPNFLGAINIRDIEIL